MRNFHYFPPFRFLSPRIRVEVNSLAGTLHFRPLSLLFRKKPETMVVCAPSPVEYWNCFNIADSFVAAGRIKFHPLRLTVYSSLPRLSLRSLLLEYFALYSNRPDFEPKLTCLSCSDKRGAGSRCGRELNLFSFLSSN